MFVVAYVSGHGFGHSAREIEVLRHLPERIDLVVKSSAPEWFWRAGLDRPFEFVTDSFDVGCIQRDSIQIDVAATFAAYEQIDARNRVRLADEVEYLKRVGARVVVSDVPSFPLIVAAEAGIAGLCVCNFTWVDIYADFAREEPRFKPYIDTMIEQYARATLCLDTDLSLAMPYWPRREKVGLVARPGSERRDDLALMLPDAARGRRTALIYLGGWGYPLPYAQLETLTDWQFLSLDHPPSPVANWTVVDRSNWRHSDLVASVDLVVSKPGYGMLGECLSAGTPLLYPPRPQFAEYFALEEALTRWPGGIQIPERQFLSLEWRDYLANVPPRSSVPRLPSDGGPTAAARIADFYDAAA